MSSKLKEGKLPQGWEWATLGEICEINPRKPKNFVRDDSAPTTFVPMKAVNAIKGEADIQRTEPYGELKKGYTYFINGDVLFAKITPCMQNGKHFIAKDLLDEIGFASTEFHVLRPNALLFAEWVHFYLRQPSLLKQATYHFTGAVGQQRVPASFLKELEIPLPPLSEQKRIVADLNKKVAAVEKARAATLERVEAIRALPAAFLREIFSFDSGKLPQGWRWVSLSEICNFIRGVNFKKSVVSYTPVKGYLPILRAGNISIKLNTKDDLVWISRDRISKEQLLQIGDIVVCMSSGSRSVVGKTASLQKEWAGSVGAFCGIIRTKDIQHSQYLSLWFRSPNYLKWRDMQARGANIQNLRVSEFENISIPLPPFSEQKRIVADLNKKMTAVEKACDAAEAESEATHALPAAFLREAFSGTL